MLRIIVVSWVVIYTGSTIFPIGLWWFDLYQQKPEFSTGYKVIDLHQALVGFVAVFFDVLWGMWSLNYGSIAVTCNFAFKQKAHHYSRISVKYPCKNNGNKFETVCFDESIYPLTMLLFNKRTVASLICLFFCVQMLLFISGEEAW